MNVNVVMFDLDGTLVNTVPAIANAFNKVLTKYSYKTFEIEEYKKFIGNGFPVVYDRINDILDIKINKSVFLEEVREVYKNEFLNGINLYEGIEELLDYLVSKNKVLVISTNKDHDLAIKHVETILSKWKFSYVFGRSITGEYPPKPSPYSVNKIMELGYKATEILYIGDMEVDLKTANNAGVRHIHVNYGYETKKIEFPLSVDKAIQIIEVIK